MAAVSYHIANLLEKMTSADKDFRFMATNDLMSELQKDSIKLDEDSERKVVKMLLKLLEDKNGEVQNLAVKCLGPLVNKVKEHQVETIVDTLCTNMTSDNEQLRDVSSIGLKTVIAELPPSSSALASNICKRITPRLTTAIGKQSDVPVQLEALDILADLLLRFGGMLVSFHQSVEESLMPQLASARLAVRKRAIIALSHLVATCSNALFQKIMDFLITSLQKNTNLSTTRTYVNCVAAVSRSAGHRFGDYLPQVMPLLVKFCDVDDDELREFCIQAFDAFVVRSPKEITPFLPTVIKLCSKYLCFDPNYHYDDEHDRGNGSVNGGGAMDADFSGEDSEAAEYSDDEDVSWKVRRASAKCLEAVVSTRREMLAEFYRTLSPLLISRFKEREENVKADIFHTYTALLRHTKLALPSMTLNATTGVSEDMMEQDEQGIVPLLIDQVGPMVRAVNRQLREKSGKTRQLCFTLLSELLHVMPGVLADHMGLVIPGVQYSLNDKNSNSNMKIDTLSFLNTALVNHNASVFHPYVGVLVPLTVQAVQDGFYKVVAEALTEVQQLVKVLRPFEMPSSFDFTPYVGVIYDAVFVKLKATDIDQEVKEKAISCMGQLVATFGDYLNEQLKVCLPILLERLKNEITRLTTVRALVVVAHSPLKIDLRPILGDAMPHLASFLRKNQRALKLGTLVLFLALTKHYAKVLTPPMLECVLVELPALVNEADLQIAQMTITLVTGMLGFASQSVNVVLTQFLSQLHLLLLSPLLQGSSLNAALEFLQALMLSDIARPTYQELLTQLVQPVYKDANLHRAACRNVAKAIASMSACRKSEAPDVVNQLIGHLKDPKSAEQLQYFSLMAIGEMGRLVPIALRGVNAEQIVLQSFASTKEEIQKAASLALGGIAVGDLEKFLPFVLNEIQTQPKRQYLLLIALKEIISVQNLDPSAVNIIRPHITDIWNVLLLHAECNEEGTRNVVAECLGKLCLLEPQILLPKLKSYLTKDNPLARATVVTAVKFTIVDTPQAIDPLLRSCIGEFLHMLTDADLNVRRVALGTFNSAAHNKPSLVRDLLETLLPNLYTETKVRRDLIREVEMGPFKHTVDDGLDLRKAAFECMYTLLESCLERLDIFEFLNHVEDGLKDHYDIKMLTYLMLTRLASLCPHQVLQRLDRLVDPLKQACVAKVKANSVKQEYEKQEELKRAAIRAVVALQQVSDSDKNPQLNDFLGLIRTTPELLLLYEAVQKDPAVKSSHDVVDTMDTS